MWQRVGLEPSLPTPSRSVFKSLVFGIPDHPQEYWYCLPQPKRREGVPSPAPMEGNRRSGCLHFTDNPPDPFYTLHSQLALLWKPEKYNPLSTAFLCSFSPLVKLEVPKGEVTRARDYNLHNSGYHPSDSHSVDVSFHSHRHLIPLCGHTQHPCEEQSTLPWLLSPGVASQLSSL